MTDKKIRKSQIQQQNGLTPTTPATTPAVSNPKVDVSVWLKQGTTKDQAKQLGATDEDFNKIDGGDFGGNENGVIDDFEVLLYYIKKHKESVKQKNPSAAPKELEYTLEQAKSDGISEDIFNTYDTVNFDKMHEGALDEKEIYDIYKKAYEERTGEKVGPVLQEEVSEEDSQKRINATIIARAEEEREFRQKSERRSYEIEFSMSDRLPALGQITVGMSVNDDVDPITKAVIQEYAGNDGVIDERDFQNWQNDQSKKKANRALSQYPSPVTSDSFKSQPLSLIQMAPVAALPFTPVVFDTRRAEVNMQNAADKTGAKIRVTTKTFCLTPGMTRSALDSMHFLPNRAEMEAIFDEFSTDGNVLSVEDYNRMINELSAREHSKQVMSESSTSTLVPSFSGNIADAEILTDESMQEVFRILGTDVKVFPTMNLKQAQARGLEEEFRAISSNGKTITTADIDKYKLKLLQERNIDMSQFHATMLSAQGAKKMGYLKQMVSLYAGDAEVKEEFKNAKNFDDVLSFLGITKEEWVQKSNSDKGKLLGDKLILMLAKDLENNGQFKKELDKLQYDKAYIDLDAGQITQIARQKVVQSYFATISSLCDSVFSNLDVDDNTKSAVVQSLFDSLKSSPQLQSILSFIGVESIKDKDIKEDTANALSEYVRSDAAEPDASNVQTLEGALNTQNVLKNASKPVATEHFQAVTNSIEDAAVVNVIAKGAAADTNDQDRQEFLYNVSNVIAQTVETIQNGGANGQSFEDIFNNTLQTVFPDYVPPTSSSSSSSGSTGGNTALNGGNSGSGNVADYINYVVNQFNNDPNTSQVANTRSQSAMSNPVIDYNQEQINRIDYVLTRETSDEKTPMWMRYSDAHLKSLQKNQLFDLIADNFDIIKDERIRNKITNYFAQMGKPALINLMMSSSEKVQKFLFKNGYIDFNTIEANIHTSKQMEQLYNSLQDVVREDLTEKARVNYEAGNHLTVLEEMLLMPEDRTRIAQKVDDFRHFEQEEEAKKRKEIDV